MVLLRLGIYVKKLVLTAVIAYLGAVVSLWATARSCEAFSADYALVFGYDEQQLTPLSASLQERLDTALQLYRSRRAKQILLSGGLSDSGHFQADMMARYLLERGVPAEDILRDNLADSAHQAVMNAARLLDETASVVAVTERYQLTRARLMLREAGFREVYGYHPRQYGLDDLKGAGGELFALLHYSLAQR